MQRCTPAALRFFKESLSASLSPPCTHGSCLSWNKSSSMSALRQDEPFSWPYMVVVEDEGSRFQHRGAGQLRAQASLGRQPFRGGSRGEQPTRQSRRRRETAARVGGGQEAGAEEVRGQRGRGGPSAQSGHRRAAWGWWSSSVPRRHQPVKCPSARGCLSLSVYL